MKLQSIWIVSQAKFLKYWLKQFVKVMSKNKTFHTGSLEAVNFFIKRVIDK